MIQSCIRSIIAPCLLVLLIVLTLWNPLTAQVNLQATARVPVPEIIYPSPDSTSLIMEDALAAEIGDPYRIGTGIPVVMDILAQSSEEELPDGSLRSSLIISASGAQALALCFSEFSIPRGCVLTIAPIERIEGGRTYTSLDNPTGTSLFATGMISGERMMIQIDRPAGSARPVLRVSEVVYIYRGADAFLPGVTKSSGNCEVNINCSPEGDLWQDEKRGVARVQIKLGNQYYVCSGSLVNNTAQNCTPYFLMAEHCGPGVNAADLLQWVFYFNYEGLNCNSTSPITASNTITGAVKRASAQNNIGSRSDMLLLELNQAIPDAYQVYYNGWNRSDTAASQGVGIHHPAGDIKKISHYTSPLTSFLGTHWEVHWAATTNGHGVTEGGSSGSPIFDASGRVMGTLTGGYSSCSNLTAADWYGKMWYHWDQNGSSSAQQLKPWLDPLGTGVYRMDGSYCIQVQAGFVADTLQVFRGQSVHFSSTSTGAQISHSWTFEGGNPAQGSDTGHSVLYNNVGEFGAGLIVSSPGGVLDTAPEQTVTVVDSLWGNVSYANALSSPLSGVSVFAEQGGSVADSAQSNAWGYYGMSLPADSGLILYCVPEQNIPGGTVNSVDALLIMKHFVGLQPLTGVHLQAADVDGSGVVNATDALQVAQFFAGLRPAFAAGAWTCEVKETQSGQDVQRINLKVVVTGDVNGSWVPAP